MTGFANASTRATDRVAIVGKGREQDADRTLTCPPVGPGGDGQAMISGVPDLRIRDLYPGCGSVPEGKRSLLNPSALTVGTFLSVLPPLVSKVPAICTPLRDDLLTRSVFLRRIIWVLRVAFGSAPRTPAPLRGRARQGTDCRRDARRVPTQGRATGTGWPGGRTGRRASDPARLGSAGRDSVGPWGLTAINSLCAVLTFKDTKGLILPK